MNRNPRPPNGGFHLDETLQVLRAIYRDRREGYLTLTAIHPDKKQRTPSRHLHITDKAGIHQALADLLQVNQMGWGAFFSVALRKESLTVGIVVDNLTC